MKRPYLLTVLILGATPWLCGQSTPSQVIPIFDKDLQSPYVVEYQLQQYLMKLLPTLPHVTTPEDATNEAEKIRARVLTNVVFHGWPQEWVDSPPKFEDMGVIPSGKGYRLRKLRYEIVPGFYTTAILYEPENLNGKVPAVLNLMGHHGPIGKGEEFEQKLCINEALRGMISLNPEWLGMGELTNPENTHWYGGQVDLVGANDEGLFFLAMRRALDYLWQNPNVDRERIAVTGLSGGGWQTIVLSSLDKRVNVSIPVAGYTTLEEKLAASPVFDVAGDIEQNPSDLLMGQDYSTLTAIRAPRPTLLIYNAEDDCCYRAPLVKPYVFDAVRPFFKLYGKEDEFQFYENTTISAHNYELDDRQQTYRFLAKFFGLSASNQEIDVGPYVKTYDELAVGLPPNNLTILGLAKRLAAGITRPAIPTDSAERAAWVEVERSKLKQVIRYNPVTVSEVWPVANIKHSAVESVSYRFLMSDGLGATGVWLKNIPTGDGAPLTIVINDKGKRGAASEVWDRMPEIADRMDRSEQVLALDLMFTGDAAPVGPKALYPELLSSAGHRALGIEAAQLIALTHWARDKWHAPSVHLESSGIRSQVEALVTTALAPQLFSETSVWGGMHSLQYLLDKPVRFEEDADLFCLDLYKNFDLDRIILLTDPTKVLEKNFIEDSARPASDADRQHLWRSAQTFLQNYLCCCLLDRPTIKSLAGFLILSKKR